MMFRSDHQSVRRCAMGHQARTRARKFTRINLKSIFMYLSFINQLIIIHIFSLSGPLSSRCGLQCIYIYIYNLKPTRHDEFLSRSCMTGCLRSVRPPSVHQLPSAACIPAVCWLEPKRLYGVWNIYIYIYIYIYDRCSYARFV